MRQLNGLYTGTIRTKDIGKFRLFYRADTRGFWWMMRGKEKLKEITREQRYRNRPALKEIFKGKDQKSKDQVMYEARLQYGYTLKEIAEYIGVHYSTVSRANESPRSSAAGRFILKNKLAAVAGDSSGSR